MRPHGSGDDQVHPAGPPGERSQRGHAHRGAHGLGAVRADRAEEVAVRHLVRGRVPGQPHGVVGQARGGAHHAADQGHADGGLLHRGLGDGGPFAVVGGHPLLLHPPRHVHHARAGCLHLPQQAKGHGQRLTGPFSVWRGWDGGWRSVGGHPFEAEEDIFYEGGEVDKDD